MNGFDLILTEGDITLGCIRGSERALFIKTGQGGTLYGDGDRYLKLAVDVRERLGYSVFVSRTVDDSLSTFLGEMRMIDEALGTEVREIYYLGFSKGGLIASWYAKEEPRIRRVLSVNAPLMVNFHNKTLPGIKALGERITMVYGTRDPSFPYVPFISRYTEPVILDGADHNLSGSERGIGELAYEYLLRE